METNELNASVPEEQVSGGAPEAEDTNVAATETPAPAAEETGNKKEETVSGTETPAVDFADEEADLQASAPEFDLGENTPEEESGAEGTDRESGTTDFGNMNKTEIVDAFAESLRTKPVQTLRREAEAANRRSRPSTRSSSARPCPAGPTTCSTPTTTPAKSGTISPI